jgi:alpha-mannosidase
VKSWNEACAWPKLRIATVGEFLDYVEKNHAAELPVHRQAWPDWWTERFGSAARETAASRETHAGMQINEALLAMWAALRARPNDGWAGRAAAIQEALLFYDEHTFGAAESISDPGVENSMVQWGEKSIYAWEAVRSSALLREEAMGLLQSPVPRSASPTIAVFNTLGRARSGLVRTFIDHEIRLFNTDKRIEFHYDIRKAAVRSPESVYVAFPFNAPAARGYYEAQGGTALPGEGQLPGSASDWQTVQSYVAVRNGSGQILLSCT